MHHHISFFKSLLVVAFVLVSFSSFTQKIKDHIVMVNPLSITRNDELIVLSRSFAEQHFGKIDKGMYLTIKDAVNKRIIVQFDDLNSDGVWDEFAFLYSFAANEKVELAVEKTFVKPEYELKDIKAHVRQKHKSADNSFGASVLTDTMPYNNRPTDFSKQKLPSYLTEGPAWENDKVGFRKYFDTRNANDLWGKKTSEMVMDFVGVNPDSIYHHLSWWGMDILKVGKSLGCGAVAVKLKLTNNLDTIIKIAVNTNQITYKQIADGPVRAMFNITYKGCNVGYHVQPFNVTELISIWGGQFFYQNEIKVEDVSQPIEIVTGIPDFFQCPLDSFKSNATAVMYSHGKQSENNDMLGMAVMVPRKNFVAFSKTGKERSDFADAFLIEEKPIKKEAVLYRFYSAWQLTDQRFADKKFFQNFLEQQSKLFAQPVMIR